MPIKILKLTPPTSIKSNVSAAKKEQAVSIPLSLFPDSFDKNIFWETSSQILEKVAGEFSKEDLVKIQEIKKKHAGLSTEKIKEMHSELCKKFYPDIISMITTQSKKVGEKELFGYNPVNITAKIQKIMKNYVIELFALKQLMYKNSSRITNVPYSEWFDTNLGVQNKIPFNKRFVHPCNKILQLCGSFTDKELEKISGMEKKYGGKNISDIWKEKQNILNKIHNIFSSRNIDFMGTLSDKERKLLKTLAMKYTALNKYQTKQGYFSKNLEAILFNESDDFKSGEYMRGLGLVTDRLCVDNNPVAIVFSDNHKRHSFKMYDEKIYQKIRDFVQKLPQEINLEELNGLNVRAEALMNTEKNALISEIHFEVVDGERIEQLMKIDDNLHNKIKTIINNNEEFYFISSYQNHKKKEYPSAAKILGIKMLKLLKEKNGYPLFLRAQAYNSEHSPVSLYLRAGFEPISKPAEEVKNIMNSNRSEYLNEPLYMYAENFDKIGKIVDIMSKTYSL